MTRSRRRISEEEEAYLRRKFGEYIREGWHIQISFQDANSSYDRQYIAYILHKDGEKGDYAGRMPMPDENIHFAKCHPYIWYMIIPDSNNFIGNLILKPTEHILNE